MSDINRVTQLTLPSHWLYYGRSATGFVLVKVTVFLAPLMLSAAIGVREYGMFEYAMAWALPLALLASLGFGGAIPYFLLKRSRPLYTQVFHAHVLVTGALVAVGTLAYCYIPLSTRTYLTIILLAVAVIQMIHTNQYKATGAAARASLVESGMYVLMFSIMVVAAATKTRISISGLLAAFDFYLVILIGMSACKFRWQTPWKHNVRRYQNVVRFGFPLVFVGVFATLLTSSGRLLAGSFLSMEAVGIYSVLYRVAAGGMVFHQLVVTICFRQLYQSEDHSLDRYFTWIIGLIFVLSIALYLSAPILLGPYLPLMRELRGSQLGVYLALTVQMPLWSGTGLNEAILARENLASKHTLILMGSLVLLIATVITFRLNHSLTLLRLCQAQLGAIYLVLMAQVLLLRRRGIRMVRAPLLGTALVFFYVVTHAFMR
jgi:O-antigen/teichoic acid export membrane protein